MDTVFLILIVIAWIAAFVVLPGWLADRKGYSFILFAVFGLFFAGIALLVAALIPRTKEKKAEQAVAAQGRQAAGQWPPAPPTSD
jgi:Zn-dependent protease with chaperone function